MVGHSVGQSLLGAETAEDDYRPQLWIPRHVDMQDAARVVGEDDEDKVVIGSRFRYATRRSRTFDDDLLGDVRPVIHLLLAASALVMLVAMVNAGTSYAAVVRQALMRPDRRRRAGTHDGRG